jgi:hypothetical protein
MGRRAGWAQVPDGGSDHWQILHRDPFAGVGLLTVGAAGPRCSPGDCDDCGNDVDLAVAALVDGQEGRPRGRIGDSSGGA